MHLLASEQESLSRRFGDRPPGSNPFDGIAVGKDEHGLPLLPGALALLACRVTQAVDAGDHTLFVAEVESIDVAERDPLLYFRGAYRRLESGFSR